MEIDINPRGNGACPLCVLNGACRIQKALAASAENLSAHRDGQSLEVVIYSCPQFKEQD